ncbi:MAG: hypothetical protein CK424_03725 [Legionella sp.]|nr:MAG: hypothetical protein CK424_03725 [Legionella sp.]
MPNLIHDLLGKKNDIELFEFISNHLLKPISNTEMGADDLLPSIISLLNDQIGSVLATFSIKKLKALRDICHKEIPLISGRIIITPDLKDPDLDFDFELGDTIVTSTGVYQITQKNRILKMIDQFQLPALSDFILTSEDKIKVLDSVEHKSCLLALNKALKPIPSSLYISENPDQEAYGYATLTAALSYLTDLAEKEIYSKKIRSNNLILKALNVQTESELLEYADTIPVHEIEQTIRERIRIKQLSVADLETLLEQCEQWIPLRSARITSCRELPPVRAINNGDTFLLPTGLVQIQKDSSGKIEKHTILNNAQIVAFGMGAYIPQEGRQSRTFEDDHILVTTLNPYVAQHPKGIYITPKDDLHRNITKSLSQIVQTELEQRKAAQRTTQSNHPDIFWNTKPNTQAASINKKANISSHSSYTQITSTYDPHSTPRTLEDVERAMHKIKDNLNIVLEADIYTLSNRNNTVQILKAQETVIETSCDTVTIFKTFMKNKIPIKEKAVLFLNALDIPPLKGRNTIEISGGNLELKDAIQDLFDHYLNEELKQAGSVVLPPSQ